MIRLALVLKVMAGISQAQSTNWKLANVCIRESKEAGPDPVTLFRKHREESDISNFGLMGEIEKAYSVPYELTVCHDEDKIHGLQLTLTMHRFPFEGEEEMARARGAYSLLETIDKMIEESTPRRMDLIGSVSMNCETVKIY